MVRRAWAAGFAFPAGLAFPAGIALLLSWPACSAGVARRAWPAGFAFPAGLAFPAGMALLLSRPAGLPAPPAHSGPGRSQSAQKDIFGNLIFSILIMPC